ncbi:biotin--[acetyl-CoA-carboxylase] ligase [Fertoebacter nigrum]|uniref:biotin--[biotin carboxyl-carrier protein] ligase n=1 Tax=Fertoeibacter niger TaxID=2656921 RepID=A0A8X8H0T3_9RHOB|nr:biotin--[acetyl-CoA-carboxylase] ligase [Fertoeibacter niger]NUB43448.1 biotin--[acetyl-CoA-carboxylase] ligase [Fertoeibacter niger]
MSADWPLGVARHLLDSVDSTNAHAARLARGLSGPAWIVAAEQTAGKGRRGRDWRSPRGNFYGTYVMRPTERAEVVALRSFAAALALREACVALTGLPGAFALKWPNDVLVNGGKLAGILLESAGQGGGVSHLAIGIGVNLIGAPEPDAVEPGALRPVSLLAETGKRIEPSVFLDTLAPAYARWEAVFTTQGFAPLRAEWLAHAARLGEPITARSGSHTREGMFETVDAQGALVLMTAAGRVAIPAAEVFF